MPKKTNHKAYLLIVESSSKCKKIESFLGPLYQCIACHGHIRSIDGLHAIDQKNNYNITFSIDPDKAEHVKSMKSTISLFRPENIYLATDHDREGEAIAWHLCDVFKLPVSTTKRIVFHEITSHAIIEAVANPRTIDMNLVKAQQARQVCDMLVGFKISPLLWRHICQGSLSAGRCQTPALRLVYENDKEHRELVCSHKVNAAFFTKQVFFQLNTHLESDEAIKALLETSKTHKHILSKLHAKQKTVSPPKPFNTSSLLQHASNLYGRGAKDIMAACQTLYQQGYITYMRTTGTAYAPEFVTGVATFITNKWSNEHVKPVLPIVQEGSTEPHEAIRVTNIHLSSLDADDFCSKVYKMIWLNTLQSCMSSATFNVHSYKITAPMDMFYETAIEIPVFDGFLAAKSNKKDNTSKMLDTCVDASILQLLDTCISTSNVVAPLIIIETVPTYTGNKSHYTEASLIDKLDQLGIGRPSTFAMLVDTIQTRTYVERKDIEGIIHKCNVYKMLYDPVKKDFEMVVTEIDKTVGAERAKLIINPVGSVVIEFLLQNFSEFFSYDYTQQMESELDKVAAGMIEWHTVCATCDKDLSKCIKKQEKIVYSLSDDVENPYEAVFCKNNLVLRHKTEKTADGKPVLIPVKKDMQIDITKLSNKGYTYAELADDCRSLLLGNRDGVDIVLKKGKFGKYVEMGEKKVAINIDKPFEEITLDDVDAFLQEKSDIRVLSPFISIRHSKHGAYVFYKTLKMKKPKFFDLKGIDWETASDKDLLQWIQKTHKL